MLHINIAKQNTHRDTICFYTHNSHDKYINHNINIAIASTPTFKIPVTIPIRGGNFFPYLNILSRFVLVKVLSFILSSSFGTTTAATTTTR